MAITIMAIFVSSCKKEEMQAPVTNPTQSWKTNDWVLVKKDVQINGVSCDLYENTSTGQKVFEEINEINTTKKKKLKFNLKKNVDHFGYVTCPTKGHNCWVGEIEDLGDVIVLKR